MKDYINRLQVSLPLSPTYELLSALQSRHIEIFPWENLDVYFKKHISLNTARILDKFLKQNRGGICFELNGAYNALLKCLGFNVKLVQATIYAYEAKVYNQPRHTHVVSIVEIEGQSYLSDVAWDGYRKPLLLTDNKNEKIADSHRVIKSNNTFQLHGKFNENYILQYQFTDHEIELSDIECYLDYSNADPEREVTNQLLFKQYTPTGYRLLANEKVFTLSNETLIEQTVNDLGGLQRVLSKIFHLNQAALEYLGLSSYL